MSGFAWFMAGYGAALIHIIAGLVAWHVFLTIGAWYSRRKMDKALAEALILESADY